MKSIKYAGLLAVSFSAFGAEKSMDWSGCFIGAHGGTARIDNHFVGTFFEGESYNDNLGTVESDGEFFGLQAGCRMQFSSDWVLGFRISGSDGETDARHLYINGTGPDNFVSYESDNLASISGQLGFLLSDASLLYMNLGYGQIQMTVQDTDPFYQPGAIFFQNKRTLDDLVVGIGYEYRFSDHWSVFAEYNQIDFGTDRSVSLNDFSDYWDINDYTADIEHDMDYFQLGVNFNF